MSEWTRDRRKNEPEAVERRFRAPVDLPVVLRYWRTGEEEIVIARAFDLSGGGIGVLCDVHLSLGTQVTVAFELDGEPMSVRGKVAHRRRVAHNSSRCGIEFNALPQEKTAVLLRAVYRAAALEGQRETALLWADAVDPPAEPPEPAELPGA
jgi:c-di-GMP-binding flagellar brake protein YcgR